MGWEKGSTLSVVDAVKDNTNYSELVLAKYADDTPLNLDVVRGHHDGSHFRICRLQANLAGAFAIEALQSCFFAANQPHHDITRIAPCSFFPADKITAHIS